MLYVSGDVGRLTLTLGFLIVLLLVGWLGLRVELG